MRFPGSLDEAVRQIEMFKKDPDSEALLQLLREPDGLASEFVSLIPFLRRRIKLAVDRRISPRLSPDDIVQETFLIAQQRLDDFLRSSPMPFNNWIALLAQQATVTAQRRHLARRRTVLRERHIRSDVLSTVSGRQPPPDSITEGNDQLEFLLELMERLSPSDKRILLIRNLGQRTNAEAAEILGITRLAASKRYSRALQRLREIASTECPDDTN